MYVETNIARAPQAGVLMRLLRSHWLWLALLAGQFAGLQLVLGVQYGDGPRNLHWGRVAADNPRFLVGDVDPNDMVSGWTPSPPTLAPGGVARTNLPTFNSWWGPVPIVLMAAAWWATGALRAMALV